jgi:carbonic anhydrase
MTSTALLGLGVGCASGDGGDDEIPRWTYEGEAGPENWGDLHPAYEACSTGQRQSPIDIPASVPPAPLDELAFQYDATPVTVVDNGHTIQAAFVDDSSTLTVDGKTYALEQFHFHARGEHTRDGQAMPLEMHLVHVAADDSLAVIAVMFDVGVASTPLSEVFGAMPEVGGLPAELSEWIDPSALVPANRDGWVYSGSLTTPPCSEGVSWHVFATALDVSAAQLEAFTSLHAGSFRPTRVNLGDVSGGH